MDDLEKDHIQGFINSFIEKDRRSGWVSALIDKPSKAYKHLVKFGDRSPKQCRVIMIDRRGNPNVHRTDKKGPKLSHL